MHQSANTIGTILAFEKEQSNKYKTEEKDYAPVMTWAFVFVRPPKTDDDVDIDEKNPMDIPVTHECWMFCEKAIAAGKDFTTTKMRHIVSNRFVWLN